jgi:hypothetical protein
MDNNWRPGGTVFGFGSGLGWATERGSGCIVPPVSIKDRPLLWMSSQVTDLLSRAHTYLWEWEDLFLFCHGFRLFPGRLIGDGDRWRSLNRMESGTHILGAWSPSLDGDLELLTGGK